MFDTFLAGLRSITSNDATQTRRKTPRRANDRCVAVVNGQTFPVENWSFGGILLVADGRLFGTGSDIEIALKFKLHNTIIDVTQRGRVIRKANEKIAIEFESLGQTIRRSFQQVIDDSVASEFAMSQS
jgi:hypothetical protein